MESVLCPACQKPIRVPEDVLGQVARCPFCKSQFRAPVRSPEGLTQPVLLRRNLFGRNRIVMPAVLMLMIGLVGLFQNVIVALQSVVDRPVFEANTRRFFESLAERAENEEDRERLRDRIPAAIRWRPVLSMVSAGLSLVSIAGAVAMLRKRLYGFALLASFVTMFNVSQCCCFASILVGGYCLYVLLDPEVRASFR